MSSPSTTNASSSLPELPWAFIDCPTDTLVILISHMLNLLIQHNDQVELTPDALTRFHSRAAPGISVVEYLRRIVKYTNLEKIPLLSLLAYIDTTCTHLPTFTLSSLTVHRFLIAGVCAGSKAQCDVFCTNAHYAKVGGIKTGELNALEREFLRVTKWDLCCKSDLLQRYYASLIRSHGGYTQAPPPSVSPFLPFPRSASKPRQPVPSASEDGDRAAYDSDADAEEPEPEDEIMPSSPPPELSQSESMRGRKRRSSQLDHHQYASAMDVDAPGEEEPPDNTSPTYTARSSSSVPSSAGSSRSRLRGVGSGVSEARPAEVRLDRSSAAGEVVAAGPEPNTGGESSAARRATSEEHDHRGGGAGGGGPAKLKHLVEGLFHHRKKNDPPDHPSTAHLPRRTSHPHTTTTHPPEPAHPRPPPAHTTSSGPVSVSATPPIAPKPRPTSPSLSPRVTKSPRLEKRIGGGAGPGLTRGPSLAEEAGGVA